MRTARTYIHFPLSGQIPANLPPQTRVVRVEAGLAFGALATGFAFALVLWLLWRPLPGFPLPPGPALLHLKAWVAVIAGSHSPAAEHYRAWADGAGFLVAWGRPLLAVLAALAAGCFAAWVGFKPRPLERHLDGAEVKDGDASTVSTLQRTLDASDPQGKRWLKIAPGLELPQRVAFQHVLIAGGTGCGKTTFLWPVYNRLRRRPGTRSFCFDPKGDFTQGTSEKTLLISPTDRRSAVWDIARDLNTPDRARAFAEAVVISGQGKDTNPYFTENNILIFTGVLVALQKTHGENWGWGDFYNLAILPVDELREVVRLCYPQALDALPEDEGGESKQAGQNKSSFTASIQPLMPLCNAWMKPGDLAVRFSIRHWLKADYKGPRHIVLQPCEGARGGYYIGAMLALAARVIINPSFKKLPEGIAFILDELPALGKVEALGKGGLIDKSRSLNCCLFLGFQSVNQLRDIYGRDQAEAFLAMVPNVFLGRTSGGDDAAYWVKTIGKERVQKMTLSHNSRGQDINASWGTEERDAIMAKDLAELGARDTKEEPGWGIDALLLVAGQWQRLTFPGFQPKQRREAHMAAEWTLADSERQEQEQGA